MSSRLPFQTPQNRSAVGTAAELIVCVDLMKRGFEVFRAISHTCSCDIVILRDGILQRVEVKTSYRWANGKTTCALPANQRGRHDVLAKVFLTENVIEYTPDLPTFDLSKCV